MTDNDPLEPWPFFLVAEPLEPLEPNSLPFYSGVTVTPRARRTIRAMTVMFAALPLFTALAIYWEMSG